MNYKIFTFLCVGLTSVSNLTAASDDISLAAGNVKTAFSDVLERTHIDNVAVGAGAFQRSVTLGDVNYNAQILKFEVVEGRRHRVTDKVSLSYVLDQISEPYVFSAGASSDIYTLNVKNDAIQTPNFAGLSMLRRYYAGTDKTLADINHPETRPGTYSLSMTLERVDGDESDSGDDSGNDSGGDSGS